VTRVLKQTNKQKTPQLQAACNVPGNPYFNVEKLLPANVNVSGSNKWKTAVTKKLRA